MQVIGGGIYGMRVWVDPDTLKARNLTMEDVLAAIREVHAGGRPLGTFEKGLQERVKLSQVSPHVVEALISTEDHRFYQHHGVVGFCRLYVGYGNHYGPWRTYL